MFFVIIFVFSLMAESDSENGLLEALEKNLNEYWMKGWQAYQDGEFELAAGFYEQGLIHDITNGENLYNLACCYGLLGNKELAAAYLDYSIKNGFDNYDHIINDPDFAKVKDSEEFKAVVLSLKAELEKKEDPAVKTLWFEGSAYAKTYLRLPDDFDPQKIYPLVVGLHGYGAKGENFIKLYDAFESRDFIYVCPETFYLESFGTDTGYSWFTWSEDEEINREIVINTEEYVERVTREILSRYQINKVYLLGFSQGCGLAYTAGIRFHELYNGLICFGGWLDDEHLTAELINKATELQVFIAHGNIDKRVDNQAGKNAYDILKKAGYKVKFFEFDGGHTIPAEGLKAAQNWLDF
jgi:predicted esterase